MGWMCLYESQQLRKENEVSIQVILLMACQTMTIYFGSAHCDVDLKQAELRKDIMRKNSSSRVLNEWEALDVEARRFNWGAERSLAEIKEKYIH